MPMRGRLPWLTALLLAAALSGGGCFHTIHVAPEPDRTAEAPIPAAVRVEVAELTQQGPGNLPRIYYLKWTKQDLQQAIERYLQKRGTFAGPPGAKPELVLSLTASLQMDHNDRYSFRFRVQGTFLREGRTGGKVYSGAGWAPGPWARWSTASDQGPIKEAVRLALDELFAGIEADGEAALEPGTS